MGDPVGAARHVREATRDGRDVADRRAACRRPRRGQPQPGRPRLLRVLHAPLHAGVALAGGRARAGRAGGRGAHPRRRHERRLHALPPRGRDAVQPRPRGAALTLADARSGRRRGRRASRRAPATPTRRATSSATACASSTRSSAAARRRCCCSRPGRSSTRVRWKMQVPYLARHFRVITFDGRGNGLSDRPEDAGGVRRGRVRGRRARRPRRHGDRAHRSWSVTRWAAQRGLLLAANHPERVRASSSSGPRCRSPPRRHGHGPRPRSRTSWTPTRAWAKYNRHYWLSDYAGFLSRSSSRRCSPSRTRPSRSRTASAGVCETDAGDADRTTHGGALRRGETARGARRARPLPGARDPRRRATRSARRSRARRSPS